MEQVQSIDSTVKGRYQQMASVRENFLLRARECSVYTLPYLIPPTGYTGESRLPTPYQSHGARCVNNLASKLQLALLPPNSPLVRLAVDDFTLEQITDPNNRAEVEKALNKVERAVMSEIEASNPKYSSIRTATFLTMKHLLVGGNVMFYTPSEGGARVFPLNRYVVKRGGMGEMIEAITEEDITADEIPEEIRDAVIAAGEPSDKDKDYKLYTHIMRMGNKFEVMQELNGIEVPGSRGSYPVGKCPWMALRLMAIDNQDYGPSFVEEYLGDVKSLEALSKAIVRGSAAAAKVLFLVRPNSTTRAKVLAESESGDVREGNAEDVTVLQLNKLQDFRVAQETRRELVEALSFAFLLNTAVQRNGERVTAEEIRYLAGELEQGLGGVYSTLSQDFQLPLVNALMHRLEKQKRLPPLPEDKIKPTIVTGIEAIGRGNDLTKLQQFFQALAQLGPEAFTYVNLADGITRLAVSMGIDSNGLVKGPEEVAETQQQQQLQQLVQQLGPNAVNQVGGLAQTALQQAPQGEPPNG